MKKQVLSILFSTLAVASYGQLHFSIDNLSPCAGQSVTFSLPLISGCSNPRVASEAEWKIYPVPQRTEVRYNFSAQNSVKGYTSITLTYMSYHPTISVQATYACNGKQTGTVSDLVNMMPPVAAPAISGLEGKIYPGDQSSVNILTANASGYSWSLTVVEAFAGSIDQSAIINRSSQQTMINWPANFVGVVDVIAGASGCSETKQTTKRVSVLNLPSAAFYESSVVPIARCAETSMRYRLEIFGGFTITQAQVIVSGGASNTSVFSTRNGVPVEWTIKWLGDGDVKVRYSVSDGNRTWADRMTPSISFDVLEFDAGQIDPILLASYCAPASVSLSLNRQPTGSPYVFQYCNQGDCSVASSAWSPNDPATSPTFTGINTNTSFRIKLTDNRCGSFQSTPVTILVKPTPSIAVSDKFIFSGRTFDIPSSNTPFSTVNVKVSSNAVRGASDVSISQGSEIGILSTQVLSTEGKTDGTVVYSMTPSKDGCTGQTKNALVTVYHLPVIETDRKYVYKGLKATLTTQAYDSYLWQTTSGNILGTDPHYLAVVPNTYIVTVTKNGARGTSEPLTIGGQFSDINENYILTRQPSRELKAVASLEGLPEKDVSESILYLDGLGRPRQNINVRMSPSGHDVVQPLLYDRYGRENRKFLPYVSSEDNGRIRLDATSFEQPAFYQQGHATISDDLQPYAETVFEDSPLNRILKQGSPGSAWQPHEDQPETEHVVKHQYALNTAADSIMRFNYDYLNETIACLPGFEAFYAAGVLYRNQTTDEDNHEVVEFVDKLSRTLCRKVRASENSYACTYYVYDDIGHLVFVLPPEGAKAVIASLSQ